MACRNSFWHPGAFFRNQDFLYQSFRKITVIFNNSLAFVWSLRSLTTDGNKTGSCEQVLRKGVKKKMHEKHVCAWEKSEKSHCKHALKAFFFPADAYTKEISCFICCGQHKRNKLCLLRPAQKEGRSSVYASIKWIRSVCWGQHKREEGLCVVGRWLKPVTRHWTQAVTSFTPRRLQRGARRIRYPRSLRESPHTTTSTGILDRRARVKLIADRSPAYTLWAVPSLSQCKPGQRYMTIEYWTEREMSFCVFVFSP